MRTALISFDIILVVVVVVYV